MAQPEAAIIPGARPAARNHAAARPTPRLFGTIGAQNPGRPLGWANLRVPTLLLGPKGPERGSLLASQTKTEARRSKILKAAQKVFAEKGFHDATIAEIARAAGVSEGSIYEYFSSKEGVLFSIPLEVTRESHELAQIHVSLIRGAANRLRALVYMYLALYEGNPDYASVILLILKHNQKFRDTEAYDMIRAGFRNITETIKSGMANGEFRPDINPYVVRSVLMGAVDHLTTNWLMGERKGSLTDMVDPVLDVVMEGVLANDPRTVQGLHWSSWQKTGRPRPEED